MFSGNQITTEHTFVYLNEILCCCSKENEKEEDEEKKCYGATVL